MIIGSLQRLMVVPAVTLTFAIVFQLLSLESCVLLLFAALPTAQSCYVMTASMGGDSGCSRRFNECSSDFFAFNASVLDQRHA